MDFIKKFWNNLTGTEKVKVKVVPKKVKKKKRVKPAKITTTNIGD
tara:strand:- start:328 stop:462 length:135 start_codon:yes stop_codon:yes gene_type:complete